MIKDHISRNVTHSNYRVVLVRATQVAQLIGSQQHQLSGTPLAHFCDGILAALLLATQLKGSGVLSFEFDSDGAFDNYRCDATPLGLVRAMIPKSTFEKLENRTPQQTLIGNGNLYVSQKIETANQPFRSVLELVSDNITQNVSNYLKKSQQINGIISLCTIVQNQDVISCDGFLIEEMPNTKEDGRAQMEAQLKRTTDSRLLFAHHPTDEKILQKLLGDITYVNSKDFDVSFFCPCSQDRFMSTLAGLPREELEAMTESSDTIETECDFCKKVYDFNIKNILNKKDSKN